MSMRRPNPPGVRIPWWRRFVGAQSGVYWECSTHGTVYEAPYEKRYGINGFDDDVLCPTRDEKLKWYVIPNQSSIY